MPYSKNPDKYPLEIQQLPDLLSNAEQAEYNIPARDAGEARGRKTQIQSYFAAVEARAKEMRQLAIRVQTAVDKSSPIRKQDQITDAHAIAELWEGRARTTAGWMVRTLELGGQAFVQLQRRTTGDFGAALAKAFSGVSTSTLPTPPSPDKLEEQLALLRQASEDLQRKMGKTD